MAALEIVGSAYDTWDVYSTFTDPEASARDKAISAGGYVIGAIAPFAGYGAIGKQIAHKADEAAVAAAKHGDDAAQMAKIACSFAADTPILTASGFVPIAGIKAGDLVTSMGEDGGGETAKPVLNVFSENHAERVIVVLKSADGTMEALTTTLAHPFNTAGRGWAAARDLQAGDQVRAAGNAMLTVVSVSVNPEPLLAYNFEVADTHTYFVGASMAWVHNACAVRGYKIAGLEDDAFSGRGVHINATVEGIKGGVHVSFDVDKNGKVVAFINDKISGQAKKAILEQVNKNLLTDKGFMEKLANQANHVAESSKYSGNKNAAEVGKAAGKLSDAIKGLLSQ